MKLKYIYIYGIINQQYTNVVTQSIRMIHKKTKLILLCLFSDLKKIKCITFGP